MSADAVLVLNAGSSSLKYQVVQPDSGNVIDSGIVEKIGSTEVPDHRAALRQAFDTLAQHGVAVDTVSAVGHRVVHGGRVFHSPTVIDDAVLAELQQLSSLAPLHNPPSIAGIEVARELLPEVPQVAVFDTAFFFDLPLEAATYAIDASLAERNGLRRYGFHGTSHEYVSQQAAAYLDRPATSINQIVLHLGNGASASAIRGGTPIDTSMGLTPLEGLVMGTRSGDVDPGLVFYLQRELGMSVEAVDDLLNRRSGLKGLCGENDFRAITAAIDDGDEAAAKAYAIYIHRLRKYLGAYAFALGRLDAVVFTAGVGENSPTVRRDALANLENFGIVVDPDRNEAPKPSGIFQISSPDAAVAVLVVPTNEELSIARSAAAA